MNAPFIDSNYIVALVDEDDSLHHQAVSLELHLSRFDQIVPDVSLIEAVSVLARRSEEKRKTERFPAILETLNSLFPVAEILWLSPSVPRYYRDCFQMMATHHGQLNFNDCLLVTYMHEKSIKWIVSFDKDFDAVKTIHRIKSPDDVQLYLT
ncbi:MAG: type II toxin-antitoxin system VapC family toxin [Bacteroidota bacterium]